MCGTSVLFLGCDSGLIVNEFLSRGSGNSLVSYEELQRNEELESASIFPGIIKVDSLSILLSCICGHRRFTETMLKGLSRIDTAVITVSTVEFRSLGYCSFLDIYGIPNIIFCIAHPAETCDKQCIESYLAENLSKLKYSPLYVNYLHLDKSDVQSCVCSLITELKQLVINRNDADSEVEVVTAMIESEHKLSGKRKVVGARIASGTLQEEHTLYFSPGDFTNSRIAIRWPCNSAGQAFTGDYIGISIDGKLCRKVATGSVLCNRPLNINICTSFTACVYLLRTSEKLRIQQPIQVVIKEYAIEAVVVAIKGKLKKRQFVSYCTDDSVILPGECSSIEIKPLHPVCIVPYSISKALGSHIYRLNDKGIAYGLVVETH